MPFSFRPGLLAIAALGLVHAAVAEDEPLIRDGDTIVFFGDSITQAGDYIDHFEAALLARYPAQTFRVFDRGISSETISGTSETDHNPRRPWAHERFERDIVPLKPNVVIACFGMNDGNYHPFDWGRFEKYQQGVRRLIQRVKDEAKARQLILLTPPPFDPYRRKTGDEQAEEFGYKYAAIDYDETLAAYAEWLLSLDVDGVRVIDLHGPMNDHAAERRKTRVSFTLSPDAIHPNITGHWLMSFHLLLRLDWPEIVTIANRPLANGVWTETLPLPVMLPLAPDVDRASVELEAAADGACYVHTFRVARTQGIEDDVWFELFANDKSSGDYTAGELRQGINLAAIADLATQQAGAELYAAVRDRRRLEYYQFRAGTDKPLGGNPPAVDIPAKIQELTDRIEKLRQPAGVKIRLEPVER